LAIGAVMGIATPVSADTPPTAWDLARDPAERDRWALHEGVQEALHPPRSDEATPLDEAKDDERSLERARDLLEESDAAHSPDVRLAFDLGIVYERLASLRSDDGLYEKAAAVLTPALARDPDATGSAEALSSLAAALARLDRPRAELATWRRYIPKIEDDERRLTPMMNMGEAQMRLGQIDAALSTFRATLDLCTTLPNTASLNEPYALILWDIAIAQDRQDDPMGALRTAAKARSFSWTVNVPGADPPFRTLTGWDAIQDYVDVFFVPDWEREWYLALGEASAAADAADPNAAARGWEAAEHHWDTYFTRAAAAGRHDGASDGTPSLLGRWAVMARFRRDHARKARTAALARTGASR
jgi:tetratricopeptide (TPR) repeat protein